MAKKKINAAASLAAASDAADQGFGVVREITSRAGVTATEAPVTDLIPNSANPGHRTEDGLDDLVASLREVGVLQPLVVRPRRDGDEGAGRWMILGGHRRWAAAKRADLETVPVHVVDGDAADLQLMLVENLQRQDVTPMEEGRTFQLLIDQGHRQQQIAKMVSVSQGHVSKRLSLLKLDAQVQDALDRGKIGLDAVLAVLKDAEPQDAADAVQKFADRDTQPTTEEVRAAVATVASNRQRLEIQDDQVARWVAMGAKEMSPDDLPSEAISVWEANAEENETVQELIARNALYVARPDYKWGSATLYTDDADYLKQRADKVDAGRAHWRRLDEISAEYQTLQVEITHAVADAVPEKAAGEAGDLVARQSLRLLLTHRGIGVIDIFKHLELEYPEWNQIGEAVDALTKGQRWKIAQAAATIALSGEYRDPDWPALAGKYAPASAARWADLDAQSKALTEEEN